MSFLDRLVTHAQDKGAALWRAFADRHEVEEDTAAAVLAAQIQRSNEAAANAASLAFSAQQSAAVRRATPAPPVVRPDETARLRKAATTALETAAESDNPQMIIDRLVRSENLNAAAQALRAEVIASPHATGYRRKLNPGACELCSYWAKGGKTFAPEKFFPTHPGCACIPDPVFTTTTRKESP